MAWPDDLNVDSLLPVDMNDGQEADDGSQTGAEVIGFHAQRHNAVNARTNLIIQELGANPSGRSSSVRSYLDSALAISMIGRLIHYGHSLAFGAGASSPDRRVFGHIASMLQAKEFGRSIGGAVLSTHDENVTFGAASTGNGGYATVLQTFLRPTRRSTTVGAGGAAAGATSLTMATAVPFSKDTVLHVGDENNGEIVYAFSTSGTTLNLEGNPTNVLANAHAAGEPIYETGQSYEGDEAAIIAWYGNNDHAFMPIDNPNENTFFQAFQGIISRFRCAEVYENNSSSIIYNNAGTDWAAPLPPAYGVASGHPSQVRDIEAPTTAASTSGMRQALVGGATMTILTPANFRGGDIVVGFLATSSGSAFAGSRTIGSTVDGAAGPSVSFTRHTFLLADPTLATRNPTMFIPLRITGLTAGRHRIVVTMPSSLTNLTLYSDWWGVEALEPPKVIIPSLIRPRTYQMWAPPALAQWANGQRATTLTGAHNAGVSAFTVASTAGWYAGQTVSFEEGAANTERLIVNIVTSGTTFTTTSPTTKNHAGGTSVMVGQKDSDIPVINARLKALCDSFPSRVDFVDVDTLLDKQQKFWWQDNTHLSDLGQTTAAKEIVAQALVGDDDFNLDLAASLSETAGMLPSELTFVAGSHPAINAFGANSSGELNGAVSGMLRRKVDLRRAQEARTLAFVTTANANAKIRLQYSIDNGSTWHMFGRRGNWVEPTNAEASPDDISLATTGFKEGLWFPLFPEAQNVNLLLRWFFVSGAATTAPAFAHLALQVR